MALHVGAVIALDNGEAEGRTHLEGQLGQSALSNELAYVASGVGIEGHNRDILHRFQVDLLAGKLVSVVGVALERHVGLQTTLARTSRRCRRDGSASLARP